MGRGSDSSEGQNNLEGESMRLNSPLGDTWTMMMMKVKKHQRSSYRQKLSKDGMKMKKEEEEEEEEDRYSALYFCHIY